jgi:hypothetical protein
MTDPDPKQESADEGATQAWLDGLDPATAPARVVPQEVRDVAEAVDRLHAAEAGVETAVLRARRAGATWNDLALPLGVSRQAARQRYARLEDSASMPA